MGERSADVLTTAVLGDPTLVQQVKDNPQAVLTQQAAIAKKKTPLTDDPTIYRIVTSSLCASALLVVGGIIYLAASSPADADHRHKRVPANALIALGSACVGVLGGLLSPTIFKK